MAKHDFDNPTGEFRPEYPKPDEPNLDYSNPEYVEHLNDIEADGVEHIPADPKIIPTPEEQTDAE